MAESELMFMEGQIAGIEVSKVKSIMVLSTTGPKSDMVMSLRILMNDGSIRGGRPTSDWTISALEGLCKRHNVTLTMERVF